MHSNLVKTLLIFAVVLTSLFLISKQTVYAACSQPPSEIITACGAPPYSPSSCDCTPQPAYGDWYCIGESKADMSGCRQIQDATCDTKAEARSVVGCGGGGGLTTPTCNISAPASVNDGDAIDFTLNAGDNGETYLTGGTTPSISGACSGIVGWCGTGNLCGQHEVCSNVCGGMHTTGHNGGSQPANCTISATVNNSSGSSSCSTTVIVNPAVNTCVQATITGRLIGLPNGAFPAVCTAPNGVPPCATLTQIIGSYDKNYSITLPTNASYTLYPTGVGGMTISPSNRLENVGCSDISGQDFQYSGAPPPTGFTFFQALGGGMVALGGIIDQFPNNTWAMTKTSLGREAGVVKSGGAVDFGSGKYSEKGSLLGWNLKPYLTVSPNIVNYSKMQESVARNVGMSFADLMSKCGALSGLAYSTNKYNFYCYSTGATLVTQLASYDAAKTNIYIPMGSPAAISFNSPLNFDSPGARKVVIFIPVRVNINQNVTANNSSVLWVLAAGVNVAGSVSKLDGFYATDGAFNAGTSGSALVGLGGVFAGGNITLPRNMASAVVGESFTYNAKGLWDLKDTLGRTKLTYREIAPR